MKSLLSSPMTAISAPVATFFRSFWSSLSDATPEGGDVWPLPRLTLPSPVMRIRWPFLTTQPEFVQPFAVLSARTFTLHWIGLTGELGSVDLGGGLFVRPMLSDTTTTGGFDFTGSL